MSTTGTTNATATTVQLVDYDELLTRYDPVVGLEVHVELNTDTKMFCGCATGFGADPNTQVCPVCLGLPGALPVVNAVAVESAIRIGLALNAEIAPWCRFARKNYFYPDMPKNFQTSQYDEPIAFEGHLDVDLADGADGSGVLRVPIERAHMEEDTGKSLHVGGTTGRIHGADHSLVDYNRAGIPLIEIVTKPITGAGGRAPAAARAYVAALREVLRSLGVSDVKMEQGSLRCDANVSLRPRAGEDSAAAAQMSVPLGVRTETKNVNSLRSVERAVRYEMCRQAALLDAGEVVPQETRHWHEDTGVTTAGRPKSDADDYRYFPEPDLVPIAPSHEDIERLRAALPEPPAERRKRLQGQWQYSDLEMRDVVNADALGVIEETVAAGATAAAARKWWTGDLARRANQMQVPVTELGVTPAHIAELDEMVRAERLNDSMARQVMEGVLAGEGTPEQVADERGLALVQDDDALDAAVADVIAANPDIADKIRGGKLNAVGALIGQVMKQMRGQADAAKVRELILSRLT